MPPDPYRVFIIHGRNLDAQGAMVSFLRSLGLKPWTFNEVSARLGGAPFIGLIVREGMENSQATIAMFTPDEYASLRPNFRNSDDERGRWQSRPNVLFEAGLAFGIDDRRTILVTLGTDVRLFSDVDGRHIVRLDNHVQQRELLRQKLKEAGCSVDPASPDWFDPRTAGDFEACLRPMENVSDDPFIQSFDELEDLKSELHGCRIAGSSLLEITRAAARKYPDWLNKTALDLVKTIKDVYAEEAVDTIFWWWVVLGVLRFKDIEYWWDGEESWANSVKRTKLATRGKHLLNSLTSIASQ